MTNASIQVPDIRLSVRQPDGGEREVVCDRNREQFIIGRLEARLGSSVDLPVADRHISRRHCEIAQDRKNGGWTIRDLLSSNGTRLNDELITDTPIPLLDGHEITVGLTSISVTFDYSGAASELTYVPETLSVAQSGAIPEGATVLFGGTDDGTGTMMLAPGALSLGSEDATTVLTREDATTVLTPQELARALLLAPSGQVSSDFKDETAIVSTVATVKVIPKGASDHTTAHIPAALPVKAAVNVPPKAVSPTEAQRGGSFTSRRVNRRQELYQAGFRGIALDLAAEVFPEEARLTGLCRQAQESGQTFFRVLAEDSTIKAHDEIYQYVAKSLGLDLITTEKDLMERAIEEDWLTYAHASSLGAVLMAGGGDDTVLYATLDPYDIVTADWIAVSARAQNIRKQLVLPIVFKSALQRLKNRTEDEDGSASVLVINLDSETEREIQMRVESVEVPKIVNYFLQKSFFDGSSDIHIEPTEDFLLVRNRVDGILHELTTLPASMHPEIVSRIKILSGMDVAEKRRPQDGRIATVIRENAIDVRVSSYPTIYGEKVVMRLLDKNALRPSPEHLGMISRDLRLLYDKLDAPFGLVMISGPTGSGKTTTLYSCLSYIDKKTKNVLTVEDPVEYRLKGVHQMQVNEKIGLTFASGLRTILRQDPDVIMVGECRDAETASMAIQAALTGHIVFSTIHTNDAVGVITRLIDMGVEPFLVANALSLCIAQRLVRRVCKHCQAPEEGQSVLERLHNDGVSDERLGSLGIIIDPDLTYVTGRGCVHCRNTGYQGRQAVFEIFEVNQEVRAAIVSPKFNADEMRRWARASSMTTLIGHGMMLIDEGMTTHPEVIRVLGEAY